MMAWIKQDRSKIVQFWDFLRSVFSTFWLDEPKCTESDLKNSRICPIWGQSDPFWVIVWLPMSEAVLGNTLLEVAGVVLPLLSSLLILYSRELLLYSIFYSETRYSTRILLKSIEKF